MSTSIPASSAQTHFRASKAQELFASVDEVADFTDVYGLDVARAALYEEHGRHADAAEVHLQLGRIDEAVRLFLQGAEQDATNVRRAYGCILDEFWKILPLGVQPPHDHLRVRQLRILSETLAKHELFSTERDQVRYIRDNFLCFSQSHLHSATVISVLCDRVRKDSGAHTTWAQA